jgi:hypothetical protein
MAGANLPRPSVDENISTTLAAGITNAAESFDVSDASKIVSPCYLVIDRVDASGTVKNSSLWEYVKVTDVTGNTLTVTRAQGGSSAQAHSSGAVIEAVITSSMFEDWYAVLNPEHTSTGGHAMGNASAIKLDTTSLIVGSATITNANIISITGNAGQFVWSRVGALATSQATLATDTHLPVLRASKNLTINSIFMSVNSCPSLGTLSVDIAYRSTPTSVYASIFTIKPTIDVGEYTTDSAATVATLALTSLASGTLLSPSIETPRECGDLLVSLNCTSR